MELRQLEYFVAVAEEGTFTRAARRVHISQSGVSAQIRALETDLGAVLIDRSGRIATLTAAGRAAIGPARAALAAVDAARRAVDDVNGLIRGRLVIGMVTACTVTPLFDALAAFRTAHPGVEIALREDDSDRLIAEVRTGDIDLALVGVAGDLPVGLDGAVIVKERIVACVPAGHPLAARRRITIGDCRRYPLICLPEGTGIRTVLDRACAGLGVRPDVALQAAAPGAVADLAVRGLGVAILSETIARDLDGLVATVIDDVTQPALLALVWSPTGSAAMAELRNHCRTAFHLDRPEDPER